MQVLYLLTTQTDINNNIYDILTQNRDHVQVHISIVHNQVRGVCPEIPRVDASSHLLVKVH